MKFLVIQTAFIGDVILATGLVEKIHANYPDAQIDFLLRKGNESLLKDHPKLNKTLVFDKKSGKFKNLIGLIKIIRKEKYDVVVNAQRFMTSGLMTAFSGGKETIGFNKNPMSFLFSRALPHEITVKSVHEIDRNQSLIAHLTEGKACKPKLYPPNDAPIATADTFVCMAPASIWFTKQMPKHKWVELINRQKPEVTVYLLGGPADKALCQDIQDQSEHPKIENLAGQLSLLDSAAIMKKAQMNYVNDSAPMHLASSMNAPTTAFYCSTVPDFGFGPLSNNSTVAQSPDPGCRPCGLHGHKACPKGHFKCGEITLSP